MKDMRDFIEQAEEEGMLHRIKAEVDWDLELSHIAKLNEEKGVTFLFSTHDRAVMTRAKRLIRLHDGQIEHNGKPDLSAEA